MLPKISFTMNGKTFENVKKKQEQGGRIMAVKFRKDKLQKRLINIANKQ